MQSQTKKLFLSRCLAATLSGVMLFNTMPKSLATDLKEADFSVDSLTIQPAETTSSINFNWYAPEGTTDAKIKFGGSTFDAVESNLTTPTKLDESKYTDTGKIVCKTTVTGLKPDTSYEYQISNDGGETWSKIYTYKTPKTDEFKFAFTSDPQIKESGETDNGGWNPSDSKNQTGWAKMMETVANQGVTLMVSAGDQVEDQSWGKSSEYDAFFAPEEMSQIAYAPAVGNHDRHYMFEDHFNLPNEMKVAEDGQTATDGELEQVKTTFRGQNSGTSQSHGNYIQATQEEIEKNSESNGVIPNDDGKYDFKERREMETKGNYYYLYDNTLFVTLNTGAYPGGNDEENAGNESVPSATKDNSEAEQIVENFRKTMQAATDEYKGQYDWLIVTHHKSTQTVAKHAADSDIENYVDAGFESLMDDFNVDFVLGGHDHVYSRSYVLKDGQRNAERLDNFNDPDGTIYITGNCASDMQYYTPFDKLDKENNADYPVLANGETGSQAYLDSHSLPYGNQEWNQEYSPSYAIFDVQGDKITVNVYNLSGDSENPQSKQIDQFTVTKNADGGQKIKGKENGNSSLDMTKIASYVSGENSVDGGVMEIVANNAKTGWAYAVNGKSGMLTAIPLKTLEQKSSVDLLDGKNIDIKSMVNDDDFVYGDMTSVAVSPDGSTLAVAVQAQGYNDAGRAVLFTCNADGTLTLKGIAETGVQPDMITFYDNNTVLTADEGEPRDGYGSQADPKGSVTVINASDYTSEVVDFTSFDAKRDELVQNGVILKKNTNPSVDLEPEYIATENGKAYITLQENNAIAVMDIASKTITGIYSCGLEDYSKTSVDIDKKDEQYSPKTYENLKGIRMPDGISAYSYNGKTYLVTANEGDSREWGEYINEKEVNFGKGETSPAGNITAENSSLTGKVVFFDTSAYDGLDSENDYLFGGRSFTVYEVNENGINEVFTSGNDFESLTAKYIPEYFNTSNDNAVIDDRSGKKGPEPENVTIGNVNGKTYAFIAIERTGGIMAYDITNPSDIKFVNYINSRDFESVVEGSEQYKDDELDKWVTGGDVAPEGMSFISANDSVTGKPMLLTAFEVSGTVSAFELSENKNNDSGSSGGSSSGGSSSSSDDDKNDSTQTVTNPDGSTTTTVDNADGSKTETTTHKDGSSVVVKIEKDGTVKTDVSLSNEAIKQAQETNTPISLPINSVSVAKNSSDAQAITVDLQGSTSAKVEIPVNNANNGTVAVIVNADGTEQIIKTSVVTENGIKFNVPDGATIKIIDNSKSFNDVSDNYWGKDAVLFATSHELFNGTGNNEFSPASDMNRAMIVTVLARLDGVDTSTGSNWYENAVNWAKEQGISDGSSLNNSVSREQIATMLYRYAGSPKVEATNNNFTDSDKISSWANDAMTWAINEGLISGMGNGTLNPNGKATRSEVATILMRFCEKI